MGLGFEIVDEVMVEPSSFHVIAYADTHQMPAREQPQPMQPGQRKPGTPIRPEDDQRRTHPPRRQGPGQQEQRPSPNRQVRPK